MAVPAVRVDGVWKKFGLTMRDTLRYGLTDVGRRLIGLDRRSDQLRPGEFWALQDVSFELNAGEAIGIMGANGSGKTTLLRILNGAFSPDRGRAELRGRLGALIAAGAGFSPMLTGRENIYINGSLLGMTKAELDRQFDAIVYWSGLEQFIDMPIRHYSSGMTVRLGFAVAVLGDPDVLLVDEVLAVGDAAFQKRCYERIHEIIRNGTTVIFISHAVGAIWAICNKGLFLDHGVPSGVESVEATVRRYELANYRALMEQEASARNQGAADRPPRGSKSARILGLETCDAISGAPKREFEFREPIMIRMRFELFEDVPDTILRYSFDAVHYKLIATTDSSYANGVGITSLRTGPHEAVVVIDRPAFRPGTYSAHCSVCRKSVSVHLDTVAAAADFLIRPPTGATFYDTDGPFVMHLDATHSIAR
jgi:lipopolysaccharide transport system ATP-binding protein